MVSCTAWLPSDGASDQISAASAVTNGAANEVPVPRPKRPSQFVLQILIPGPHRSMRAPKLENDAFVLSAARAATVSARGRPAGYWGWSVLSLPAEATRMAPRAAASSTASASREE